MKFEGQRMEMAEGDGAARRVGHLGEYASRICASTTMEMRPAISQNKRMER
jgi:hypothetical protein